MTCPGYNPTFQKQLQADDPLGGFNCLTYSAGMAGDAHTCGDEKPAGKRVRQLTGDTSGGTTLAEIDRALNRGWSIDLDTEYELARSAYWRRIDGGEFAVTYIDYSPLLRSSHRGSNTFSGTHGILVGPGTASTNCRKFDPLCDGRRPEYENDAPHGTVVPRSLINAAMDELRDDEGYRIGAGKSWAAFTRDNWPDYQVVIHPSPGDTVAGFWVYDVVDGVIPAKGYERFHTRGLSAPSTYPRWHPWEGHHSKRLVKVQGGRLDGKYVDAKYAQLA